ncbi:unnamed protein product [Larinioides sclopetarius]|uniref:Ribosomal protein S15 n=1 Tax=Larinioides sclopetarius TaxID=280406 RepID=A0AAV2BWC3_9ARAC
MQSHLLSVKYVIKNFEQRKT